MHPNLKSALQTRDGILQLLSDDEVAKVSTAESSPAFAEGDEYIDLEHLGLGVRRMKSPFGAVAHLIPRKAVKDDTWSRIIAMLGADRRSGKTDRG